MASILNKNSSDSVINAVFELPKGRIFGVEKTFMEEFIKRIPQNKYFKFSPLNRHSSEYASYGDNYYEVTQNVETITLSE